jgi:N-acetylglucosaminyldiphosphoundecaprenol N-acetyl-beta-D-mannosaminyltransferase
LSRSAGCGVTSQGASLARVRIAGVAVQPLTKAAVASTLSRYLEHGRPHQIVTANLDFLQRVARSAAFDEVVNGADLVVMDGKPLVWLAARLGIRCDRITGSDLISAFCRLSAERGYRLFLLGGAPGVAEEAGRRLTDAFLGVQVCGTFSPPLSDYPFPDDVENVINERIRAAKPDILLVAFGSPKQELWIHDHLQSLGVPVSVGVGACLDFLAGRVRRAPRLFQQSGLEWLYRLWQEPRRMWRRYLLDDLPFLLRIVTMHVLAELRFTRRPILEIL